MKPAARRAVATALFGAGNEASVEGHQAAVDYFVETGVGLLPVIRRGRTTFYGFADDAAAARDLREVLMAFVGPSYSTWVGPAADLDDNDPAEGALIAAADGPVIRLEARRGLEAELRGATSLTLRLLQRRPALKASGVRPQHRVLAEFELALAAGNAGRGEELLEELERSGILSGLNLLFLRLRWLYETGSPEDVLALDALPDMLRRRRPALVTIAIAAAVQATVIDLHRAAFLAGSTRAATAARVAFDDLDASYGDVLGSRLLTSSSDTWAVHVLHLAATGQIDAARQFVATVAAEDERRWLQSLIDDVIEEASVGEPGAPTIDLVDADALLLRGRFAEAVDVVLTRDELELSDAATLLRAAYSLGDAAVSTRVLDRVHALAEDVLGALRRDRMLREIEERLVADVTAEDITEQDVGTWSEWFERLATEVDWPSALARAEMGRVTWARSELDAAEGVARLARAIERCGNDDRTHASALGGLSHLLTWLEDIRTAETDLRPLHASALELVIYAADPSEARDDLVVRLLDRLLTAGIKPEALAGHLQDLADRWDEVASPRRVDWPIAVADVVLQTTGTTDALRAYLAHVLSSTARWADRLDDAQRLALISIGTELDIDVAGLAAGDEDLSEATGGLSRLSGLTVGLYTLTKGVGQRVAAVLGAIDGVDFEVNDDHVSTERLLALARRADVMVVVKRSAKHSATEAIFSIRGLRDTPVPAGKGSAAVLRALQEWVVDRALVTA